jgi:hypothetical protein
VCQPTDCPPSRPAVESFKEYHGKLYIGLSNVRGTLAVDLVRAGRVVIRVLLLAGSR